MLTFVGRLATPAQPKPKRRAHKEPIDPVTVVTEAARVGDSRFQQFVETGKHRRSK